MKTFASVSNRHAGVGSKRFSNHAIPRNPAPASYPVRSLPVASYIENVWSRPFTRSRFQITSVPTAGPRFVYPPTSTVQSSQRFGPSSPPNPTKP